MTLNDKTPVTIITGFLGAGKTTLGETPSLSRRPSDHPRVQPPFHEFAVLTSARSPPPPFNVVRAVNHILTAKHGKRIAIIEKRIRRSRRRRWPGRGDQRRDLRDEQRLHLPAPSARTSSGSSTNSLRRKDAFDHIIIETTGLADPAPVAQTFFVDEDLKEKLYLDAILTVVDVRASIRPTWTKSSRTGWRTNRWSRSHSPIKSY